MSFPRYPKYKPSGVEWLGDVPEGWEVKRIGYYFKERREKVSDKDYPALSVTKNGIVPQLDTAAKTDDGDNRKRVCSGDFVINSRSDRKGSSGASDLDGSVSLICTVLCPQEHVHTPFIHHLLRSQPFQEEFYRNGKGIVADLWSTNYSEMRNILLGMPPLPEQTAIAKFLDRETAKIDDLVAEQRRLMELLKEKRQAVISHAVTKGLNPRAPMKPSGIDWLGDVPQTWTVIKLGRAVFMQEGPGLRNWQFTDEGTRVICVTNITETGIDFTRLEKFISTEEYNSSYRHFTVQHGDVLLSSSGNSWGKVAIYEGEEDVILNTSTIRLNQSKDAPLNRDYIALLLQSDTVREQLGLAMTGSCQPNFGPTHLNSVMVAIPSTDEQAAIVAALKNETAELDALTAEAQRAIDLLQERRTALISAAVTGQIDVRDPSLNVREPGGSVPA